MVKSELPLVDAIDMDILMHRDAHFGGSFDVMLDYYENEGVGSMPDFELDTIQKLQAMERQSSQPLSETYLPAAAVDVVNASKALYQQLRDVYSDKNAKPESILLSDLILAEDDPPTKEIQALTAAGSHVVPGLIHLISSPTFYDPMFPGYGRSPIFAAQCLGKIQDPKAIPALFEALGQDNFFTDEAIIASLASFGNQSKDFLLKRLKHEPFSKENEYAAIALNGFPEDEEIGRAALELLENPTTLKHTLFASYLIFACNALTQHSERERFITISNQQTLARHLAQEMTLVIKSWGQAT